MCLMKKKMWNSSSARWHFVFNDEATIHLNGKMNHHDVEWIWELEWPRAIIKNVRDSSKNIMSLVLFLR